MRREILEREGGRRDDVEFTFVKGKWNHLGEATLMNRIKSHPDVSERWYPDLLKKLREQQAAEAAGKQVSLDGANEAAAFGAVKRQGQPIKAH